MAAAVALAGTAWFAWLMPTAAAGAYFVSFDIRNAGREEAAEITGAAAFALLPAALAVLGGAPASSAVAVALIVAGRAVPTVLTVRAALRAVKMGVCRGTPALLASFAALGVALVLVRRGLAPWMAAAALAALALRACAWLVYPKPPLRARTMGMIEAALGLAFVAGVASAWDA
jgi:hypothetical protein